MCGFPHGLIAERGRSIPWKRANNSTLSNATGTHQ